MELDWTILRSEEQTMYRLRGLYEKYGYRRFKMSKFEEYDLYVRNKDFLVSDRMITFTDARGVLMALKPDVTLSIIKNTREGEASPRKVYYNETVYRSGKGDEAFQEILQTGLECIGDLDLYHLYEVIALAVESLAAISPDYVLDVSHVGLVSGFMEAAGVEEADYPEVMAAVRAKNLAALGEFCRRKGLSGTVQALLERLVTTYGTMDTVLAELAPLCVGGKKTREAWEELSSLCTLLKANGLGDKVYLDFSVEGDMNYYSGLVFRGFLKNLAAGVLSGGQYDKMVEKMGKRCGAMGFAIYLNELERLGPARPQYDADVLVLYDDTTDLQALTRRLAALAGEAGPGPPPGRGTAGEGDPGPERRETGMKEFLNVALPKGRLGERVYAMFAQAGFPCEELLDPKRKLIFENPEAGVRYFWVKPSDVPVYVERGAADVGVAGKDILLEYGPDIYELLDLNVGKCRMCVAAKNGFRDDPDRTLRVATEFPNITRTYYAARSRDIDIIRLHGSIEIAPILDLTDVIVDIVETGTTLRENDLTPIETIVPISARLIANKVSFKFKHEAIQTLYEGLTAQVAAKEAEKK